PPCASDPCMNGGNCSDSGSSFFCSCPDRYTGDRCQIDETPPESDTEITVFGASGDQATIPIEETVTFAVVLVIAEQFVPDLQNKRSQVFRNMRSRFLVFLIPIYRNSRGFIGIKFNSFSPGSIVADINILYNSTEPIPTAEEVQSPLVEARDNGSAPFTVKSLQVAKKVPPCANNPCMNGGKCSENGTSFSCLCPDGYTGRLCEIPIPPCASAPCANGGNCSESGRSFSCLCPDGYTDDRCEIGFCPVNIPKNAESNVESIRNSDTFQDSSAENIPKNTESNVESIRNSDTLQDSSAENIAKNTESNVENLTLAEEETTNKKEIRLCEVKWLLIRVVPCLEVFIQAIF
ncbi:fibropellin-1-like isoform X6, partial [Paramuricea clavata]